MSAALPPSISLRVLVVEDSDNDCQLLVRALERAGWEPDYERVDTAEAMAGALDGRGWDLIVSDYHIPGFGAAEALALYRERHLDLPFLIVSGSVGEEQAVDALKAGAHDFFLKGRLARLGPAVARALADAENARARRRAEDERQRALLALMQSEERHRLASEMAKIGVWDWDLEEPHGHIDPALKSLLGFGETEIPGDRGEWANHVHPEDVAHVERELRAHLSGRTARFEAEHRMIHKDGSVRWFLTRGTAIRDAAGRPLRIVGASMDVSDRRSLESQFQQAQKMEAVGRLAGGVAHDFNNLLGVITGYGEMLLRGFDPESRDRTRVEHILKAAERAARLTRQLLAFSRRQVLQPRVLDLNAVVSGVEPMLRRLIGEDVRIVTALAEGLMRVRADPGQIEQVIVNLAVNARDAMPHGGRLILETSRLVLDEAYSRRHAGSRPGPHVVLAVSDTGHGMDRATLARAFEPFFTTKEQGKGTGLGLATIHGIVVQSGGHVCVYSELGRGTTIKVYLPAAQGDLESEADVTTEPPPRGSERVLVVEDESALREVAREVLEEGGYRVVAASGAEEALQIVASHPDVADLLLTDVVLPGMSGPELAARVRALRPTARVAYVSGYSPEAIGQHGVLEPGAVFIEKPFTADTLLRKVRQVLDARG